MNLNQLVHQDGERLFVTSLDISNYFGKRHTDVLRAIDALECSADFAKRNFALVKESMTYVDSEGVKRQKETKRIGHYQMTRDGFTFLCMGFTGAQAAQWKERYITAFNQMETALRATPPAPRHDLTLAHEVGNLRNQLALQNQVVLGLYQRIDSSQRGHIRAMTQLLNIEKRQAKREAKELVLALLAQGVSRDEIARRTGKTLNHIRQLAFQHKAELPSAVTSTQSALNLEG